MCALTSSRLDDFFRYNYVYTVMITIIFLVGGGGGGGGEAGHFGEGKPLPLKYHR